MKIDETTGEVIFYNLISTDRELGSDAKITIPTPAAKAVATNAKGVFENKEPTAIRDSALAAAKNLSTQLLSS